MKADLLSKLLQVIEQIPKDVLYDFCCSYAQEHEELAMALVNEFWRPEKDDYRSMVQQCLMHPTPSGIKNGDQIDMVQILQNSLQVVNSTADDVRNVMQEFYQPLKANERFIKFCFLTGITRLSFA